MHHHQSASHVGERHGHSGSGASNPAPPELLTDNHHGKTELAQFPSMDGPATANAQQRRGVHFQGQEKPLDKYLEEQADHMTHTTNSIGFGGGESAGGGGGLSESSIEGSMDDPEAKASSFGRSSRASSRNSSVFGVGKKGNEGSCKSLIQFFASSVLAMTVPIVLIIVISSLTLSDAIHDLDFIHETHDLVIDVAFCNDNIMVERDKLSKYLQLPQEKERIELVAARAEVDTCRKKVHDDLSLVARNRPEVFRPPMLAVADDSARLAIIRAAVDSRQTNGTLERLQLTEMITRVGEIDTLVQDELKQQSSHLIRIHALQVLINYLAWCRSVGVVIVRGGPIGDSLELREELVASYSRTVAAYAEAHSLHIKGFDFLWDTHPDVSQMWRLISQLAEIGGAARVRALQSRSSTNSSLDFFAVSTRGVDAMLDFFHHQHESFSDQEAVATLRDELIKMLVAIVVCVIAALLLSWHQNRLRTAMVKQINQLNEAKRAVGAFVPRSFLATMGYTSITQVTPGNCTETALTMLFADIRRFTTVAEGMGNTELFDWVQAYFARMTHVVEQGKGNINQFIGDALFAVFKSSRNACLTGVKMQCSVEKLNIDNRSRSTAERTVPVDIGVGIHQDCVALGVLGDEKRHTCTLISKSVNLASRLEGLTKQLRCKILVSDKVVASFTEAEFDDVRTRKLGPALVKGSESSTVVYEVFMADDEALQTYKIATREQFEELVDEMATARDHFASSLGLDRFRPELTKAAEADESREAVLRSHKISSQPGTPAPNAPYRTQSNVSAVTHRSSTTPRAPPDATHQLPHPGQGDPMTDETAAANPRRQSTTRLVPLLDNAAPVLRHSASETLEPGTTNREGAKRAPAESTQFTSFVDDDDSSRNDDLFDDDDAQPATYTEAIKQFLRADSSQSSAANQRIKSLVRDLVKAQQLHKVTDETFYRLLIYNKEGLGMVFSSK